MIFKIMHEYLNKFVIDIHLWFILVHVHNIHTI